MTFEFLDAVADGSHAEAVPLIQRTLAGPDRPTRPRWLFVSGCVIAVLVHVYFIALLTFVLDVSVGEPPDANLANDEIGNDPDLPTNYNVDRIVEVTVPAPINPSETNGIASFLNGPPMPLPPAYAGRRGATRERMLREGGGNTRSEAAVAAGLRWLAAQQERDGSWPLTTVDSGTQTTRKGDVLATALAMLPILAAGETHKNTGRNYRYTQTVDSGLKFLLTKQDSDGLFDVDRTAHALATMALCESYGLTNDPSLKAPAQRALDAAGVIQHDSGGWGARPGAAADTFVTGWFVQALKSGQMAGLNVPNTTWANVNKFLDSVGKEDGSTYGYQSPKPTPLMTAVALQCRQYLGWGPRNVGLQRGVRLLAEQPPSVHGKDACYNFHVTKVLFHMAAYNAEAWEQWNPAMRELLSSTQDRNEGPNKGSWSPDGDGWGGQVGRLGVTALSLLTLETYYTRLPLYRREIGAIKDEAVGEPGE